MVEPDHAAEWPETDILQLGQKIELLLDLDESDDPYQVFPDEEESGVEEALTDAAGTNLPPVSGRKSSGSMKTMMQLVVTLLCLGGCALLLIRDQNRRSDPDTGPGFNEIISTAIATPGISPELIQRLQHAEAQRVRGRPELAEEEYQSIRDDLVWEPDPSEDPTAELNSQILRFIQTRL